MRAPYGLLGTQISGDTPGSGGWGEEPNEGKLTSPIKDVNLIGNGPKALENVSMVGNDLKISVGGWTCGKNGQRVPVSQGLPTVRIDESVTVGGVNAARS